MISQSRDHIFLFHNSQTGQISDMEICNFCDCYFIFYYFARAIIREISIVCGYTLKSKGSLLAFDGSMKNL